MDLNLTATMKYTGIIFLFCSFICSCTNNLENHKEIPQENPPSSISTDTMPRVTGIGGVFFKAGDPQQLKDWYRDNLGLEVDAFGAAFEFRNANNPSQSNYLNWDVFIDTTDYFDPSEKAFMLNYRVQNLEGLVAKLNRNGVTILDEIVSYDYGKFVHILDAEGNKIELWEPVDSVLSKMGRKANK